MICCTLEHRKGTHQAYGFVDGAYTETDKHTRSDAQLGGAIPQMFSASVYLRNVSKLFFEDRCEVHSGGQEQRSQILSRGMR